MPLYHFEESSSDHLVEADTIEEAFAIFTKELTFFRPRSIDDLKLIEKGHVFSFYHHIS